MPATGHRGRWATDVDDGSAAAPWPSGCMAVGRVVVTRVSTSDGVPKRRGRDDRAPAVALAEGRSVHPMAAVPYMRIPLMPASMLAKEPGLSLGPVEPSAITEVGVAVCPEPPSSVVLPLPSAPFF